VPFSGNITAILYISAPPKKKKKNRKSISKSSENAFSSCLGCCYLRKVDFHRRCCPFESQSAFSHLDVPSSILKYTGSPDLKGHEAIQHRELDTDAAYGFMSRERLGKRFMKCLSEASKMLMPLTVSMRRRSEPRMWLRDWMKNSEIEAEIL
jgi:hypothetical protein